MGNIIYSGVAAAQNCGPDNQGDCLEVANLELQCREIDSEYRYDCPGFLREYDEACLDANLDWDGAACCYRTDDPTRDADCNF